ncbi:Putative F-box/LRR-repeat protein 23 [Apostasia shenzhenica]|uniref:F-box/LRR-repeat protein 23 n=1 Tax=Apostasia shenzhenica TaxID=1088818 RepID=A0A2I0B8A4_9ASPA|nr:Putative F-box/LRR-repeat protein 23 [Apostasia shenzhenica]
MEPPIERMKGTVSWFDGRRGFGFITPEEGREGLFVHYSSIKTAGYRSLGDGEAVEFVVSVDDFGRNRAVDVTGPGGGFVKGSGGDVGRGNNGSRGFGRSCHRCGEVGHIARNCSLSSIGFGGVGPCYSCGEMGHLARQCPGDHWSFIVPASSSMVSLKDAEKDDPHTRLPLDVTDPSEEKVGEEDVKSVAEEEEAEKRNWAELPRDVLTVIFKKIAAIEVLMSAQFVCKPWQQVWCIDMRNHADLFSKIDLVSMAKEAVNRSRGHLEAFYAENFGSDELMLYIAERTTILRSLRLISVHFVSDEALSQALKRFPLLEELEITLSYFSDEVLKVVGPACRQLKRFQLNTWPLNISDDDSDSDFEIDRDSEALELAKHMRQLRRLQLFGSRLTNVGLLAILDSCPYLEHLDIRRCLFLDYDESLKKKCAKIKELKLPNDSVDDYPYEISGRCGTDDDFVPENAACYLCWEFGHFAWQCPGPNYEDSIEWFNL